MKSSASSSFPSSAIVVAVVAFVAGMAIHSLFSQLPKGVSFDHLGGQAGLPPGSPVRLLPPWAIFQPAVALQDFLARAARATTPPPIQVLDLISSHQKSSVAIALTRNGIIDLVGEKGKISCENVATTLQLKKHNVCEYMRSGALLGLFSKTEGEQDQQFYSLTDVGALLQTNVPGSLRDYALLANEDASLAAWRAASTHAIRSGQSGFFEAHGMEFFPWHEAHPDKQAQFDRALQGLGYVVTGAMLGEWEPKANDQHHVICDIGGGNGANAKIILDHYPNMSAIVLDQPKVIPRANEHFQQEGLSHRARAIEGDFFQPLPKDLQECDTFFLRFILHDWSDTESVEILKNIHAVAKPGSEVVLAEYVLGTTSHMGMELSKQMMSVTMMVLLSPGSKERTLAQYQELFDRAGMMKNGTKAELIPTRDAISMVKVQL